MKKISYAALIAASLLNGGLAQAQDSYIPYGDIFAGERAIGYYRNYVNKDESSRMARGGIMIVGEGKDARAFSAFSTGTNAGALYADIVNLYHDTFGKDVTIYCMPIPTESAFYTPESGAKQVSNQGALIANMFGRLHPDVVAVDIYTVLGAHANEDIYSRTDHHWLPLGAYYAARKFASVASVPFKDLSHYTKHTIHNFVGTMYTFSKDMAVKNAPEEFDYYTPDGIKYSTTYIQYRLDSKRKNVIGETDPAEGKFFIPFPDGSSGAYCTFMGGDSKLTKVVTDTGNGRRLVILKDSFGNAVPGYLFYSFEEIHVIDCRYFTKNLVQYVKDNGITDILFANNLSHACASATTNAYQRYLVQ